MSTLSDSLQAHRHLGYTISGTTISTNVLLYADDTCLVADGPASCQHLLTCVEQWLLWTGMAAKVPKCFSLGIQSSTAKRFDPNLHLQDQTIPQQNDQISCWSHLYPLQQPTAPPPVGGEAADITGESRWVCCLRKAETPPLQGRYLQLGPRHHEPPHNMGYLFPRGHSDQIPKTVVRPSKTC